jgi:hypothetical protein
MWDLEAQNWSDLFACCFGSITTAFILGILYVVANSFQPLPEDVFRYGISLFRLTIYLS